jgi:hypothetical protein
MVGTREYTDLSLIFGKPSVSKKGLASPLYHPVCTSQESPVAFPKKISISFIDILSLFYHKFGF